MKILNVFKLIHKKIRRLERSVLCFFNPELRFKYFTIEQGFIIDQIELIYKEVDALGSIFKNMGSLIKENIVYLRYLVNRIVDLRRNEDVTEYHLKLADTLRGVIFVTKLTKAWNDKDFSELLAPIFNKFN